MSQSAFLFTERWFCSTRDLAAELCGIVSTDYRFTSLRTQIRAAPSRAMDRAGTRWQSHECASLRGHARHGDAFPRLLPRPPLSQSAGARSLQDAREGKAPLGTTATSSDTKSY